MITVRQRWFIFVAFALLVVLRLPRAWAHGRFQDEEATVFLAYAWHFPWYEALFRPFGGYLNIGATAPTTILAQLVKSGVLPLERAPYFTMGVALAVQLLPGIIILTSKEKWLQARLPVAAALLMIAIACASEEVFFNVMHIQFHLALCTALILAFEVPESAAKRLVYGLILFLAPLCGPGAIVFLPLFALRSFVDRSYARLGETVTLAAGAAVQLLFFYSVSPLRSHPLGFGQTAAAMFVRTIALPFGGTNLTYKAAGVIYDSQVAGGHVWWLFAAATCLFFGALLVTSLLRRDAAFWLLVSGVGVGTASIGFGMVMTKAVDPVDVLAGERYNFLPQVLIGLSLIAMAMRPSGRGRPVFAVLCGMMVVIGALYFWEPLPAFADGPSWPAEVSRWRGHHNHPLSVWPKPWKADLSDTPHRCSPVRDDQGPSGDPRYCESGWVASFFHHE